MRKKIGFIGVSSGWGAKHHTAANGPGMLRSTVIAQLLRESQDDVVWCDEITSTVQYQDNELEYSKRVEQVRDVVEKLNKAVCKIYPEYFPIALGGDDSMSIGTWSGVMHALHASMQFGLIYIDAHMDAHTPQTTPSFSIHGMPLAVLMGYGEEALLATLGGVRLNPQHLVLMATRSYEAGEKQLLEQLGVKIYYMSEINERGFETTFNEAVTYVNQGTKGFGISLDIDAFDPSVAPGTGAPEISGLFPHVVLPCFKKIAQHEKLAAFQIAEFDPTRDKENKTRQLIKNILKSFLNKN